MNWLGRFLIGLVIPANLFAQQLPVSPPTPADQEPHEVVPPQPTPPQAAPGLPPLLAAPTQPRSLPPQPSQGVAQPKAEAPIQPQPKAPQPPVATRPTPLAPPSPVVGGQPALPPLLAAPRQPVPVAPQPPVMPQPIMQPPLTAPRPAARLQPALAVPQPKAPPAVAAPPGAGAAAPGQPVVIQEPSRAPVVLPPQWQQAQRPGNYQKKALIFKKAGQAYDQIRGVEPFLLKAREVFFAQKKKINVDIANFFFESGSDQNEVIDTIDDLAAEMEREAKEHGEYPEEDREILDELNQNKADLNQLKQNITALISLSGSLDEALAQLDSLVAAIQTYEDQGWQIYQKVDELFDDQAASDLLGQLGVMLENAQTLQSYVQGPFSQFFTATSGAIATHMTQIKSAMQTLKDRGIALTKQEDEIDKEEQERLEAERAAAQAAAAKAAAQQKAAQKPWYARLQEFFAGIVKWISRSVRGLYTMMFGKKAPRQPEAGESAPPTGQESPGAVGSSEPAPPLSTPGGVSPAPSLPVSPQKMSFEALPSVPPLLSLV